jgi:hypothetical protein
LATLWSYLLVYACDPAVYFVDRLTDLRFSTGMLRRVQLPFEFNACQFERLKASLQFRIADHSTFWSVTLTLQLFHALVYSSLGIDPSLSGVAHVTCLLMRRGKLFAMSSTLPGIKCPYCRSTLALERIGVHFQKFCSGISADNIRETSMKKYNQFYTHIQSYARGEITIKELQEEADKLFHSGK